MLRRMYTFVDSLGTWLTVFARGLLIVSLLMMVLSTGAQVVFRYLFGSALSWPEEVNVFFMAWITFVGGSVAFADKAHMRIDVFVGLLGPRGRQLVHLAGNLVMFGFTLVLVRYGYSAAMLNVEVVSDALEIPMVVPRISLVVGGAMMGVQLIRLLLGDLLELLAPLPQV